MIVIDTLCVSTIEVGLGGALWPALKRLPRGYFSQRGLRLLVTIYRKRFAAAMSAYGY